MAKRTLRPRVGEKIRDLRKKKRVRQYVLARMVGISPGALTNFEKGRRTISLDWLQTIADALDTPIAYFLPDGEKKMATGDPREKRLLAAWRLLGSSLALRTVSSSGVGGASQSNRKSSLEQAFPKQRDKFKIGREASGHFATFLCGLCGNVLCFRKAFDVRLGLETRPAHVLVGDDVVAVKDGPRSMS